MQTQFIRTIKEKGFSIIDNTILFIFKGIFCYILSLPETWKIYMEEVMTHASDGKASFRTGLKELEQYGYIKKRLVHDESGRFEGYHYIVVERPEADNLPFIENQETDAPFTDFPSTDKPFTDKPFTDNRTLLSTNTIKTDNSKDLSNKIPASKPKKEPFEIPGSPALIAEIEKFITYRKEIKAPMTDYAKRLLVKELDKLAKTDSEKIQILQQSITNGWKGVFALRGNNRVQSIHAIPDRYATFEEIFAEEIAEAANG